VIQQRRISLGARTQVQEQRGVAAVIQDHVRVALVRPFEDAMGVIPVFHQRFALDGEDGGAADGDGGGGVVLCGVDVARSPAHFRAERDQRLDQHGGLDGHVQRAGDARAAQRLLGGVFLADRHQAGHFRFGNGDFLATPIGEGKVGYDVINSGVLDVGGGSHSRALLSFEKSLRAPLRYGHLKPGWFYGETRS
jgi:hypothetical protein